MEDSSCAEPGDAVKTEVGFHYHRKEPQMRLTQVVLFARRARGERESRGRNKILSFGTVATASSACERSLAVGFSFQLYQQCSYSPCLPYLPASLQPQIDVCHFGRDLLLFPFAWASLFRFILVTIEDTLWAVPHVPAYF